MQWISWKFLLVANVTQLYLCFDRFFVKKSQWSKSIKSFLWSKVIALHSVLSNNLCQCFCTKKCPPKSNIPPPDHIVIAIVSRNNRLLLTGDPPSCHCHAPARHVWTERFLFIKEKRCLATAVANPPSNAHRSAGCSLAIHLYNAIVSSGGVF